MEQQQLKRCSIGVQTFEKVSGETATLAPGSLCLAITLRGRFTKGKRGKDNFDPPVGMGQQQPVDD